MDNALPCPTAVVKTPCQAASNLETGFSVPDQCAPENRYDNMEREGVGGGRPWVAWSVDGLLTPTALVLDMLDRLPAELRIGSENLARPA